MLCVARAATRIIEVSYPRRTESGLEL
jgi:hypothetical protein